METYLRRTAADVTVGTPAYPRGEVVAVQHGADRWDLQAIEVRQYSPRRTFKARS